MPLAENACPVPGALQGRGQHRPFRPKPGRVVVMRPESPFQILPKPLLILTGQETGPGRRANGCVGVAIRETDPGPGQTIDVRSSDLSGAVAAQIAVAEIIGQKKDDVGGPALSPRHER